MKTKKQKTMTENLRPLRLALVLCFFASSFLADLSGSTCLAVTSKITRHSSKEDLSKGEVENIVIGSQGTLQIGRAAEVLVEKFEDAGEGSNPTKHHKKASEPWSINSIVTSGGTVFLGTSPNGGIYKYSLGKLTKIYPLESEKRLDGGKSNDEVKGSGEPNDANKVEDEQYLANEHIFAMAMDVSGRLLAGISGSRCALCRFETDKMETIFEPNDAKYIFAITLDDSGNIYLGTGPKGKIYKLDSFGKKPQLIYGSRDKNILSLAIGKDGFIYAGSDSRGLIYKISTSTGAAKPTVTVLYDSEQPEITALLFGESGDLYAAATSAEISRSEGEFGAPPLAGRPEPKPEEGESIKKTQKGLQLKIANTKKEPRSEPVQRDRPAPKGAKPTKASYIYKASGDGFVTDIFSETAIFFCLGAEGKKLLVGTGNNAQLFAVEPELEKEAVIYEDKRASQITAIDVAGEDVYLGTANPAKLIKLGKGFASEGTYTSELIDAGQPAKWGKLQIEADVPQGCKVRASSRSGNVKDVNDTTFSSWTKPVEVTGPIQLQCPLGRFCQYKLILQSEDIRKSPLVREIAVAHTIPNLAPTVESVTVERIEQAGKTGILKIGYKANDDNGDKLIFKIDFRKIGRTNWIELKDKLEADNFEWDGKTVEDARYEVRVTASDEKSNTAATSLTGSRITEPVVVDNTGPVIKNYSIDSGGKTAASKTSPSADSNVKTVTLKLKVFDELSAIGRLDYTVDSNAEWLSAVPDDLVYDTTEEDFTILIKNLDAGEHVIAIRVSDDLGNTTYKTFEVNTAGT